MNITIQLIVDVEIADILQGSTAGIASEALSM